MIFKCDNCKALISDEKVTFYEVIVNRPYTESLRVAYCSSSCLIEQQQKYYVAKDELK